jgi:hypothetical protein
MGRHYKFLLDNLYTKLHTNAGVFFSVGVAPGHFGRDTGKSGASGCGGSAVATAFSRRLLLGFDAVRLRSLRLPVWPPQSSAVKTALE